MTNPKNILIISVIIFSCMVTPVICAVAENEIRIADKTGDLDRYTPAALLRLGVPEQRLT